MALPMIETGYKPEGALGGVFAGFNAANAEQGAELELIKQFLANQREQSIQPLDVNIKQTESDRATVGRSPEMLDAYQRGYIGQNDSQNAAGSLAMGLLPFKQKADQAKLENDYGLQQNQKQVQEIDNALNDTEATFQPGVRQKLLQARQSLINRFKETPEFAQKRELKETGTDSAEYIAELRARQAAEIAAARGSKDKNPWLEFSKLSPEKRLGTAYSAITTGTNPWTMQPLNDTERGIFEMYIAQDRPVQRQKTDPKTGAVDITGVTKGEVPTNAAPTLMPEGAKPAAAAQPVGATKTIGGITYEKTEKGWIKK